MRLALIAAALLSATPALAVDFSQPILDPSGKPGEQCADPAKHTGCTTITLGSVSSMALFTELPSDRDARTGAANLSPEQKARNASLGLRIVSAKPGEDVKLDSAEVTDLKARIGAAYPPLTVYRAWMLLDPNTKL